MATPHRPDRPGSPKRVRIGVAFALLLLAALAPCAPAAQPAADAAIAVPAPGVVQELTLRDGSRLYGRVEALDGANVVFRTLAGAALTIPRGDILSIRDAGGRVAGERFVAADPTATRLFFGPTARSLPKGQGYTGVYEFVLPFVQVGVTDRFSIGGGTPLFFGGGSDHPFWLTPKLQVYRGDAAQVALGVMHITAVGEGSLGIAYGVTTVGSADNAVSVGAGWAYSGMGDGGGGAPLVMVAGEHRVGPRHKIITENYIGEGGGMVSLGVRFIGDHLSADFALAAPLGADTLVVGPLVNFVWSFGDR